MSRTEFGNTAGRIQLWRDVYKPPACEENADLGRFPYLGPDFTFREKIAGTDPWLRHVYCFNYGATASIGKVSGDIPGISDGAAWLSRSLAAALYAEDIKAHWQNFMNYDTPELDGSEWTASELPQEIDA
jgi:cation diffusion facilitator CzcD-associated flavoprotein CzcO